MNKLMMDQEVEKLQSSHEILEFLERNKIDFEVIPDGITTLNGRIMSVYRIRLTSDGMVYHGLGHGEPEIALFNGLAITLNKLGFNIKPKNESINILDDFSCDSYVCPVGKYRGRTLDQIPVDFIAYWANKTREGDELDILIKKCQEYLKNHPELVISKEDKPTSDSNEESKVASANNIDPLEW